MAGYFIQSLDAAVFEQLVTAPTPAQCAALAAAVVDDLEDLLDEYDGANAADPAKWPRTRGALAKAIGARLAAADWYADLTRGDAVIWDNSVLRGLDDKPGEVIGIDFRCENDGFLYWDAPKRAARHGAPMMAEPAFGNAGFRYSGKSRGDIDLLYTIYEPPRVRLLLAQLEAVVPHFEALPDEPDGERDQFFRGLLEPVRTIAAAGRVMWVQTGT
ncbi:hypothetical protein J0H58_22715 [bacterium]|nr:hypothetical protein [bacterium]